MERLRQSKLMRAICFFMAISIFLVSCDPHGDLVANKTIDKQTANILDEYKGRMTQTELEQFKKSATEVKAYMLKQRSLGKTLSRKDVANFIYQMNVDNGTITAPDDAQREKFAKFVEVTTWGGDQKGVINKLVEEKYFSSDMGKILQESKLKLDKASSPDQANAVLDDIRNMPALQNLESREKVAIQKALDGAESIAYYENNNTELQTRGWCEECSWKLHWVELVVSILVTVGAWILAVATFGLSTFWTSTILFTVWTATWTLVCIFVWCAPQEFCPSGQNPVCEGSFDFDASIPACVNSSFPSDAFEFGNCIYVPKTGTCPSGSLPSGTLCQLECFSQQPVKNMATGNWQLQFTCQ
jgi:hypothetical protein